MSGGWTWKETHEAFSDGVRFVPEKGFIWMSSREALIVILSRRTRSRAEQKRVDERVLAGLCTMRLSSPGSDDLADCDRPTVINGKSIGTRGVCSRCYQAFLDHIGSLPPEEAAAAEQEAIARGWIPGDQEIRKLKTKYAFARLTGKNAG